MSFGFSIGDFITVGKLVVDVVSCLKDAEGSKSDYQELIRELEVLDRALRHIDKLQPTGHSSALNGIKCAALTCRVPLEEFFHKLKKYEPSLGLRHSEGKIRTATRKLDWALRRKEDALRLRHYLNTHVGSINMLLTQCGLEMIQLTSEEHRTDQGNLFRELQQIGQGTLRAVGDIQGLFTLVQGCHSLVQKLSDIVNDGIVTRLKQVADIAAKVCVTTQQTYTVMLQIRAQVVNLDTRWTFFQQPVRLEDALGRVWPVPSEYDVGDLEALIRHRFRQGAGHRQVESGLYDLCDGNNTQRMITAESFVGLLPGMSVVMAIVLEKAGTDDGICPKPMCASTETVASPNGGRTCRKCNAWFDGSRQRRVYTWSPESAGHAKKQTESWVLRRSVLHPFTAIDYPSARRSQSTNGNTSAPLPLLYPRRRQALFDGQGMFQSSIDLDASLFKNIRYEKKDGTGGFIVSEGQHSDNSFSSAHRHQPPQPPPRVITRIAQLTDAFPDALTEIQLVPRVRSLPRMRVRPKVRRHRDMTARVVKRPRREREIQWMVGCQICFEGHSLDALEKHLINGTEKGDVLGEKIWSQLLSFKPIEPNRDVIKEHGMLSFWGFVSNTVPVEPIWWSQIERLADIRKEIAKEVL